MLELSVYHEEQEFTLQFEHSLLAVSKWESKHKKAFLGRTPPTGLEMIDYYECMLVSPGIDTMMVYLLDPDQMEELGNYINDPMTASNVPNDPTVRSNETMTSELIYYWMVALKINWDAQSWHLNRLLMLINITSFKQQPPKKEKQANTWARMDDINKRNQEILGFEE